MNRNAAIGVVLVGVLLAALSVGMSTFMSANTLDEKMVTVEKDISSATSDLGEQIDIVAENSLPRENGEAVALSAVDTLWSKGRLTVTDSSASGAPLFDVDPDTSRIVVAAETIEMGDLDVGALKSSSVVNARGFQVVEGAWAVDDAGDQKSAGSLTVGKDITTAGDLRVDGGTFRVGEGLVYDEQAKSLAVVGKITCSALDSGAASTVFQSKAEFRGDAEFQMDAYAKSGKWKIAQDGTAKFGATTVASLVSGAVTAGNITSSGNVLASGGVTASGDLQGRDVVAVRTLKTSGDKFVVAADTGNTSVSGVLAVLGAATTGSLNTGAVKATTVTATGVSTSGSIVASGSVTAAGDVSGRDLIAVRALKTSGDKFTVAADTGNTQIGGTLTVAGATAVGGTLAVAGNTTAARVDVTSLYINGDQVNAKRGADPTQDVEGRDVIADRDVIAGNQFRTEGNKFTVSASTGDVIARNITASGNVDVATLSFSGAPFTPDVGSNTGKDVIGRDIISYRTLKTDGNTFTVAAASGNTYVGGTLTVNSSISAASLSTTGNISAGGNVSATGNVSAANLPDAIVSGAASCVVGANAVTVTGMPAGASVVVTPQGPTTGPYFATPAAGGFSLVSSDAVTFSWIASW